MALTVKLGNRNVAAACAKCECSNISSFSSSSAAADFAFFISSSNPYHSNTYSTFEQFTTAQSAITSRNLYRAQIEIHAYSALLLLLSTITKSKDVRWREIDHISQPASTYIYKYEVILYSVIWYSIECKRQAAIVLETSFSILYSKFKYYAHNNRPYDDIWTLPTHTHTLTHNQNVGCLAFQCMRTRYPVGEWNTITLFYIRFQVSGDECASCVRTPSLRQLKPKRSW